ncbi:MAG: MaoC family dehydratase N-terminal domain-containing protein [Alphaproteobacteria bacterium]|nr:MaoC family dehydratase N-terminal domain-containing protein [Alphaproteobacteria bacterium]
MRWPKGARSVLAEPMATFITEEMRGIIGAVMRESVSYPISASDIRKWAMAVYWPQTPPRLYWDEAYARTTPFGGLVAPDDFNPFAWMTQKPAADEPAVAQTAFSEEELGVSPPPFKAMILSEINARHSGLRMREGDVIRSTHKITDYFEREGRMGHMLYTTLSNELFNQKGDWIRTVDSVFIRY